MKIQARPLLLSILLVTATICCAQFAVPIPEARQDSLWRVWVDTTAEFRNRVGALAALHAADTTLTPLDAVHRIIPNNADTLSREFVLQYAIANRSLADMYRDRQKWPTSFSYYEQALSAFTRLEDTRAVTNTEFAISRLFVHAAQWNMASTYLARALNGAEVLGDTAQICRTLSLIGYTFRGIGDPVRAEQTYRRCLDLASGRDPEIEYDMLLRLSEFAMARGDLTEAKEHIERARTMVAQGRVSYRVEQGVMEAEILLRKGDCAGALEHFERMRAFWQRHPARRQDHVSYAYSCKARAYLCAHRYADAIRSASEGLAIATSGGMPKESIDNLEPLAMAYEGLGDPWNALRTRKRLYTMRDSANAALADSRLTGAMLAADFAQQQLADSLANAEQRRRMVLENEAVVAREKNRRNVFLFSGIGALVLAGSLWSRLQYTRRSRAAIQKEKDISEGLLLNILPEEVAEELKAKGHADAKHFDQATILFSDFKGFTEASERMSPQELVAELNACFEAFDHIITARGIEKIKTIGDAYMCVGGMPDPVSSAPVDVVHAALAMQDFMKRRKVERDAAGLPAFEMRVGIHTGPVVAGIVGVKKFQYDIWGDTVNTASRMESSGAVGQVNISEATYELVKDEPGLTFTPRGKVQAKGKGEMEMYFVKRA